MNHTLNRVFCLKCNQPAKTRERHKDWWCDTHAILKKDDIVWHSIENHYCIDFIVSDYKPMKSAAGWYAGREYYDQETKCWHPFDRVSGYMQSYTDAQNWITDMNGEQKADYHINQMP